MKNLLAISALLLTTTGLVACTDSNEETKNEVVATTTRPTNLTEFFELMVEEEVNLEITISMLMDIEGAIVMTLDENKCEMVATGFFQNDETGELEEMTQHSMFVVKEDKIVNYMNIEGVWYSYDEELSEDEVEEDLFGFSSLDETLFTEENNVYTFSDDETGLVTTIDLSGTGPITFIQSATYLNEDTNEPEEFIFSKISFDKFGECSITIPFAIKL